MKTTYVQKLGDLFDESDNQVDRILLKMLIDLDIWWYESTQLSHAAWVKYWIARALASMCLRPPVDEVFDYPERYWTL